MVLENIFQIITTSIIQGITEFLPISSSGHLFFINKLFSWSDINLTLMISAHLGTLLAVINYFWIDFKRYFIIAPFEILKKNKNSDFYLFTNIFYSSIPIILFGFLITVFDVNYIYKAWVISSSAIFFSLLLFFSDKKEIKKNLNNISLKDSIIIGIFQIFALIPGASRAGLWITAARFLGVNRVCATKYSMYLSIPVISGATFLMILNVIEQNSTLIWIELISVFFLSFLFAYFTIDFFIKILKKINFKIFVIYRIIIAIIFLIFFKLS